MNKTVESTFCFVDKNRAVLALEGRDKIDFLQSLTTNDIKNISSINLCNNFVIPHLIRFLIFLFTSSTSFSK